MASSSNSTSARVVNSDFGGLILEHAGHRLSFNFFPFTFILIFFQFLKGTQSEVLIEQVQESIGVVWNARFVMERRQQISTYITAFSSC